MQQKKTVKIYLNKSIPQSSKQELVLVKRRGKND